MNYIRLTIVRFALLATQVANGARKPLGVTPLIVGLAPDSLPASHTVLAKSKNPYAITVPLIVHRPADCI